MPLTWTEVQQSQLFTWFNCHETGRAALPDGGAAVRLEPGGYQEFLDIELEFDARQRLRHALLLIDRAWADGPQTRAFADDLAKSFLRVLSPEGSIGLALGAQIESLLGANAAVIRHVDSPLNQPPPAPSENLQAAVEAYTGTRPQAELRDAATRVLVENGDFDGRRRVRIELQIMEKAQPAGEKTPAGFLRQLFHRVRGP